MRKVGGVLLILLALFLAYVTLINLQAVLMLLSRSSDLTSYGMGRLVGRGFGMVLVALLAFKAFQAGRKLMVGPVTTSSPNQPPPPPPPRF
jgi:hypothetical protein